MPTQYSPKLGYALPVTGELSGIWGDVVDAQITQLIEDTIAGAATFDVTAGDWTLTTAGSGSANQARLSYLVVTGNPTVPRNIIAPGVQGKNYYVQNLTQQPIRLKTATSLGALVNPQTIANYIFTGNDFLVTTEQVYYDTNAPVWTSAGVTLAAGVAGSSTFSVSGNATATFTTGARISFQNQRTDGQIYTVSTAVFTTNTVVTFSPTLLAIDAYLLGATVYTVVSGPAVRTILKELFITNELTAANNNGLVQLGISPSLANKTLITPTIQGGSANSFTIGNVVPGAAAFSTATVSSPPANPNDVVNLVSLNSRLARNYLAPVQVATTAVLNAPLQGLPVIDGYQTRVGDRVLVKDGANNGMTIDQTANGIYVIGNDAINTWARSSDAQTVAQLTLAFALVFNGAINVGFGFIQTATLTAIGGSPIIWQPISLLFPFPLASASGLLWNTQGRLDLAQTTLPPSGGQNAVLQALDDGTGNPKWQARVGTTLPVNPSDFSTKAYTDSVASGLSPKQAVVAATTDDLQGGWTYNNTAGTLTSNTIGAGSIPVIDGYTPVLNDRLLIKNEGTQAATAAAVVSPGSGYVVGQTLQVIGGDTGMAGRPTTLTVATLATSGVATATVLDPGLYNTLPQNPVSTLPVATPSVITFTLSSGTTNVAASTYTLTFTATGGVNLPATVVTASIPGGSLQSAVLTALFNAINTAMTANWIVTLVGTTITATARVGGPAWTTISITGAWSLPPASGLTLTTGPVNGFAATGSGATFNLTFSNTQFQNGLYQVTQLGTNANPPTIPTALPTVLTRTSDANTYPELVNAVVSVTGGATQAGLSFATSIPATGTLGTTNIIWVSFGGTGVVLPVTRGGTGITSLAGGLIPFGNDQAAFGASNTLYWDRTNSRLGLNSQAPAALLHVEGWGRLQQSLEKATIDTTTVLAGTVPYSISNQAVTFYTTAATANWVWNFSNGGAFDTLNNVMPIGTSVTVSLVTTQGGTGYYCTGIQIDGVAIASPNIRWQGPIAPAFGNVNSNDVYTFVIFKTAAATYQVLASRTQYGG